MRGRYGCALHVLAVDDAGGWTGLPIRQLAAFLIKLIMNLQQCPVVLPALEVVEQCASRRQVPGDIALLAPCAQSVQESIQHLAFIGLASSATTPGWGDEVLHVRPFLAGQVTRIAQLVPVVPMTVPRCPHHAHRESMPPSNHSRVNGSKPPMLTESDRLAKFPDGHSILTVLLLVLWSRRINSRICLALTSGGRHEC